MNEKVLHKKKKEKVVFPGDKLAVIEEFNTGKGSFEDNGAIKSSEIGEIKYDIEKRLVKVDKNTPTLVLPEEGMTVIAEVGSIGRRDARINIFMLNHRRIYPTYSGVIHISDISREYTKNIERAIRKGDIIKAKLVNTKNHLNQCTLATADLGVIYAYCSRCTGLMKREQSKLLCPDCGRVEQRKIARSYGKEELI